MIPTWEAERLALEAEHDRRQRLALVVAGAVVTLGFVWLHDHPAPPSEPPSCAVEDEVVVEVLGDPDLAGTLHCVHIDNLVPEGGPIR